MPKIEHIPTEDLFVKEIRVDQGVTMKRSMPRARGRAFPIQQAHQPCRRSFRYQRK
jgi:ribosomal protein L22